MVIVPKRVRQLRLAAHNKSLIFNLLFSGFCHVRLHSLQCLENKARYADTGAYVTTRFQRVRTGKPPLAKGKLGQRAYILPPIGINERRP